MFFILLPVVGFVLWLVSLFFFSVRMSFSVPERSHKEINSLYIKMRPDVFLRRGTGRSGWVCETLRGYRVQLRVCVCYHGWGGQAFYQATAPAPAGVQGVASACKHAESGVWTRLEAPGFQFFLLSVKQARPARASPFVLISASSQDVTFQLRCRHREHSLGKVGRNKNTPVISLSSLTGRHLSLTRWFTAQPWVGGCELLLLSDESSLRLLLLREF